MRGNPNDQVDMLALVIPASFIPKTHPIRGIKVLADEALRAIRPQLDAMYSSRGRKSIPPEVLLKAKLLQALFSVRSDRALCEQIQFNLLYRWFLDLEMTQEIFDHSTFTKNNERLLEHDVAAEFLLAVYQQAALQGLVSSEHFTVDGTLIEAWASLKSFKPKDKQVPPSNDDKNDPGNPSVDFHGEKRGNQTHQSTTDPEAKLARKSNGTTAKLSFAGHALMENKNGLLVNVVVTEANGRAEREAALAMLAQIPGEHRISVGADKAYDTRGFVRACRAMEIVPHVAPNTRRSGGSAIDGRTTRHAGHAVSQRIRKKVEEAFGWGKTIGGLRKSRYRGVQMTNFLMKVVAAAYNLLRMTKLMTTAAA